MRNTVLLVPLLVCFLISCSGESSSTRQPATTEEALVIMPLEDKPTDTSDSPNNQQLEQEYDFSTEWFVEHVPIWEKHLSSYRGQPKVRYLEVGLFEGRSTIWLLENILTHPTSHATGIDLFSEEYHFYKNKESTEADKVVNYKQKCLDNIQASGRADQVTVLEGYSQVVLRELPLSEPFDIIYIDGSHESKDVLEDAILCRRLLKDGGILIFDDYKLQTWKKSSRLPKPDVGINAFMHFYGNEFEILHLDWQLILRKKEKEKAET